MEMTDEIRRASNIRKLPPVVFATQPVSGELILIIVGEPGYHVIHTAKTVQELNGSDVKGHHVQAAIHGSMFGWHVPGADADRVRDRFRSQHH
jgi:hypothetical protein